MIPEKMQITQICWDCKNLFSYSDSFLEGRAFCNECESKPRDPFPIIKISTKESKHDNKL